jgi:hypothetical protein
MRKSVNRSFFAGRANSFKNLNLKEVTVTKIIPFFAAAKADFGKNQI